MAEAPPNWVSPSVLCEYYVEHIVQSKEDAEYQVYVAVTDGLIRAKKNDRILTREEAAALGETSCSAAEGDFYALPSDLELSVQDARTLFGKWYMRAVVPKRDR
jgi:hypothetical protein